jgi:hypothetical protein
MKVKLLTSRAGNRPVKREEWEWQVDEESGKSEQVLVEREVLEGFAQAAGDVIEVSPAEAKRLIEDGQAEPVAETPRRRAEKRAAPAAKRSRAKPKTSESKPSAPSGESKPADTKDKKDTK